jgi:hypothetical protein
VLLAGLVIYFRYGSVRGSKVDPHQEEKIFAQDKVPNLPDVLPDRKKGDGSKDGGEKNVQSSEPLLSDSRRTAYTASVMAKAEVVDFADKLPSEEAGQNEVVKFYQRIGDNSERESLTALSPLHGLFNNLPPPKSLDESMESLLTACKNGTVPNGNAEVLKKGCQICMLNAAHDKANNNPKVACLQQDELAAIKLYTMPFNPDSESFYRILNCALRSENRQAVKPFANIIWLLLHALRRLPPFHGTVFRGIKCDFSNLYRKGMPPVTWSSFTSTTNTVETLENPMFLGKSGSRTIFSIELTTGRARSISALSQVEAESEILLPPNSMFEVESTFGPTADGLFFVQMREVQPIDAILDF